MTRPPPADARRRVRSVRTAATVLAAVALLLSPLLVVDVAAVAAALRDLSPADLAALVGLTALAMCCWGLGLSVVLGALGQETSPVRTVPLFVGTTFLNNVTPLGQAGGDPASGALVAAHEGLPYEVGLAGIAALNALNRVVATALGVVGAAALLVRGAAPGGLRDTAGAAVVAVVVVAALAVVGWRRRRRLVAAVGPPLDRVTRAVAARVPLVTPPASGAVPARVEGFVDAVERLAAAPRTLVTVLALGAAGHAAVAGVLWTAATAVGVDVSPTTALVVAPAAKLSGLSPTPGGAGSAVVLLSGLLVATTTATPGEATAAALAYRAAAFWLPTAVGGLVAATVVGRRVGR